MEPLRFATLPLIYGTKTPALRKGFTIPGFVPGEVRQPEFGSRHQPGIVVARHLGLFVVDADTDTTEAYAEYLACPVGCMLPRELATVTRGPRFHVYVVCQCDRYPVQGGRKAHFDIKSNGFVVAAGGQHVSGALYEATGNPLVICWPELHDAIDAVPRKVTSGFTTAGGWFNVSGWMVANGYQTYADIPDGSLGSDHELSAFAASMVANGLDEDDARDIWERVAVSLDSSWEWGATDFERHWGDDTRGAVKKYGEQGQQSRESRELVQDFLDDMAVDVDAKVAEAQRAYEVHNAMTRAPLHLVQPPEVPATSEPHGDGLNLPDWFWRSSAALQHVRAYAYARTAPADAVLYGVLTRLAAARPWEMRLETSVGTPASLNLFAAICDGSGSGKSIGIGVSAGAVALPFGNGLATIPEGSGEGIAEAYMGVEKVVVPGVTNKDGSPKVEARRTQTRHNVLMRITEGQSVVDLMERAGSTLGAQLRSAWMGETIGQSNGRQETTRVVDNYAFGLVAGFQPKPLATLICETHLGTAQRFVFVRAADPAIPDVPPADPGPLRITWPKTVTIPASLREGDDEYEALARQQIAYAQDMTLRLAPDVAQEIRSQYLGRQRGTIRAAAGDEHRNLLRAKLAALLLILESDGTHVVTRRHWDLAGIMLEVSDRVREHMRGLGAQARRQEDIELGQRAGVRKLAETATTGYYESTVARILEKAQGGKSAREIWQGLSKRQREHFPTTESVRAVLPDEAA